MMYFPPQGAMRGTRYKVQDVEFTFIEMVDRTIGVLVGIGDQEAFLPGVTLGPVMEVIRTASCGRGGGGDF